MPQLLDTSLFSVIDIDSSTGVGWKLNFYIKGTSTRKNTFPTSADASAGTSPNTNPVVIDADGRLPAIWLADDADYKGVLTDENDVVKETIVQINGERLGSSGGSGNIGFIQAGSGAVARTAQAKMRETVSVLDFGAIGNGIADDNTAISNAIATGFDVYVPAGYTFAVSGNIIGLSDGQRIYGGGTVKKIGATAQPIFLLPDLSDGVWFDGITLDGNKSIYAASSANMGILGYVTLSARFTGCTFQHFRDCGIKLRDGANLSVSDDCKFLDIDTNGIEVRLYQNDPRTGNPYPTRPPVNGGYRITGSYFNKIDDGLHGAGEGCGISIASTVGTQHIDGMTVIGNTFEDVLRSIWTENNVVGGEGRNITISGNTIVGNIAGPGTTETKDGIGLIGVKGATVTGNSVLNVGNFSATYCACVQVSASDLITITGNVFRDDTGNANRTDYYVYINTSSNVTITQNTVGGASNGVVGTTGGCLGLSISGNSGAPTSYSWTMPLAYAFERENLGASTTASFLSTTGTAFTEFTSPCPGAPVALSLLLSTPITAGTVTFKVFVEGVEQAALRITQADFAGGVRFTKALAASEATFIPADSRMRIEYTTDGSFLPIALDAQATLTFDAAMKG